MLLVLDNCEHCNRGRCGFGRRHAQGGAGRATSREPLRTEGDHPFGLPEGAGSRPHLASVFQGRRKSNNIHASSGVIWGIPAKILPQIPLGRLGEPEEIAGYRLPVLGRGGVRDRRQYRDQWRPAHAIAGTQGVNM